MEIMTQFEFRELFSRLKNLPRNPSRPPFFKGRRAFSVERSKIMVFPL
jgi:hypothetical protein